MKGLSQAQRLSHLHWLAETDGRTDERTATPHRGADVFDSSAHSASALVAALASWDKQILSRADYKWLRVDLCSPCLLDSRLASVSESHPTLPCQVARNLRLYPPTIPSARRDFTDAIRECLVMICFVRERDLGRECNVSQ